jgi:hypothetical protein
MAVSTASCVRSAWMQSDSRRRLSRGRTALWNTTLHSTSSRASGARPPFRAVREEDNLRSLQHVPRAPGVLRQRGDPSAAGTPAATAFAGQIPHQPEDPSRDSAVPARAAIGWRCPPSRASRGRRRPTGATAAGGGPARRLPDNAGGQPSERAPRHASEFNARNRPDAGSTKASTTVVRPAESGEDPTQLARRQHGLGHHEPRL